MIDFPEMARYLAVGGLVTAADIAFYSVLTGGTRPLPRIPANVLSVSAGMVLGFTLHYALVFQPHEALVAQRMLKYAVVVGICVYGVQNFVIYTLAEHWHAPARLALSVTRTVDPFLKYSDDFIDRMTGKVLAVLAGVVWNFVLFKFFVYA